MGSIAEPGVATLYLASDMYNYPICILCAHWTPFLISLDANTQAVKYRSSHDIQLFCPDCVPWPAHFAQIFPGEKIYREDSILNDGQLMELLGQFKYKHPLDERYFPLDRIIITENAKLRRPYKLLARTAMPKARKLELLMELFPEMHRMKNEKFGCFRSMCAAVRRKAAQIAEGYMNLSETEHSQLQDNFDALIDRTPMHARISSQQQQQRRHLPVPPAPVDESLPSLGDISIASSVTSTDVLRLEVSPVSGNISSQEVNQGRGAIVLASQSVTDVSAANSSLSSAARISWQEVSDPLNLEDVNAALSSSSSAAQISSQEVSGPVMPLNSQEVPGPSRVTRRSFSIRSRVDSDTSSDVSVASSTRSKRSLDQIREDWSDSSPSPAPVSTAGPPDPNDGQVAGPSRKRQRSGDQLPTNPSPNDFHRQQQSKKGQRMPRLTGA